MDPLVVSTARMYVESEDPNIKAMAVEILRQAGAEPEDGMFYPATQTINRLTDIPTDDHKALVIRLELQFWEYGALERLVGEAIATKIVEQDKLRKYRDQGRESGCLPEPLTSHDIQFAIDGRQRLIEEARALLDKIKRP